MGRTKTISLKVEPAVAARLDEEAEEVEMSRSEYLRKLIENRGEAGGAVDELTSQLQDYRAQLDDLEQEVRERDAKIEALDGELQAREKKIRDLESQINNITELRRSQKRMENLLQEDLEENSKLLRELAQDFDSVESGVDTLQERQSAFLDESGEFFEDLLEKLDVHKRDAEKARYYMEKVWDEFRRYHKQDLRAKLLRRFNLIDSRHDLPDEEPELTDNPAEEHPSDN